MTDEQLHRRLISKRLLIVAIILLLASAGLLYYRSTRLPELESYKAAKAQEAGLQAQVQQLQTDLSSKTATIEENGKHLISFSEDNTVFVNRASTLASKYSLGMNSLSVSGVWNEGTMAGMTAQVEVQGTLDGIRGFISEYCDPNYTNRIISVACRPDEDYPWLSRYIDDLNVLDWLDLTAEFEKYANEEDELRRQQGQEILNNGGTILDITTEEDTNRALTLDDMFKQFTFNLYIEVDFLGRQ